MNALLLLVSFYSVLAQDPKSLPPQKHRQRAPTPEQLILLQPSSSHDVHMLNPYVGKVDPEVQKIEKYLDTLLEKILGIIPFREKVKIKFIIFADETFRIETQENIDEETWQSTGRKSWGNRRGFGDAIDREWPVRRWLGITDPSIPIFELRMSVGALRKIRTEDQLVFYIAREVAMMREFLYNPNYEKHTALAEQADQLTADVQAVEWMQKAGYSTQEAKSALDLFYKNKKDYWLTNFPVVGALRGKAHEGVRYAALQAEIENLKRKNKSKTSDQTLTTPLQMNLSIKRSSRNIKGISSFTYSEQKKHLEKLIQTDFSKNVSSPFYQGLAGEDKKRGAGRLHQTIVDHLHAASSTQNASLLIHSLKFIEKMNISQQLKGTAALRTMILFTIGQGNTYVEPYFITDDQAYEIAKILQGFRSGSDPWTAAPTLASIESDSTDTMRESNLSNMITELNSQRIFKHLYRKDSEYRKLIQSAIEDRTHRKSSDTPLILSYIESLRQFDHPHTTPLKEDWIEYLISRATVAKQRMKVESDSGLELVKQVRYAKESKDSLPRIKSFIQDISDEATRQFIQYYESSRSSVFSSSVQSADQSLREVTFLQGVIKEVSLSTAFKSRIRNYLLSYALFWTSSLKAYPNGRFLDLSDLFESDLLDYFTDLLNDQSLSEKDRKRVLEFLMMSKESSSALNISEPRVQRLHASIQKYLSGWKTETILNWVNTDIRARFAHEFSQILGEAQQYPIGDSDAELDRLIQAIKNKEAGMFKNMKYGSTHEKMSQIMMEWHERSYRYSGPIKFMVHSPVNRNLNLLSLIGSNPDLLKTYSLQLTASDLIQMMNDLDRINERLHKIYKASQGFLNTGGDYLVVVDTPGGAFLLSTYLAHYAEFPSLDQKWETLKIIKKQSPLGYRENWQILDQIGAKFVDDLNTLGPDQVREWLKKENFLDIIPQEKMSSLLRLATSDQIQSGIRMNDLATRFTQFNKDLKLEEKYPQAYQDFRNLIAGEFHVPPGELKSVFASVTETAGQTTRAGSSELRGLSGLIALSRKQPISEQIDLIEFIMARSDHIPEFVIKAAKENLETGDLTQYLRELRARLTKAETIERAMVVNSFLAGPSGFINSDDGLKTMLDYLLKDISSKNKTTAYELAEALVNAEGDNRSIAIAYVLGQKSENSSGKLSESKILKSLFEAYGVPGIKFGQYLAFTSELAEFRDVLEELQDSAMPVSEYAALTLVNDRFGEDWPQQIELLKVIGSGSVNVALRYINHGDLKRSEGVLSILRDNIENITRLDFERFNRFALELTRTQEGESKYGYIKGLSSVIEASVRLEFDKVAAQDMQNYVIPMYSTTVRGWKVGTIEGWDSQHGGNFMELAKGKSARKIFKSEPEAYLSAMRALSQVEMDRLLGIGPDGNPKPVPLYANPDFHDGQVLIDVPNRSVQILDFGQAVKITNEERLLGLRVLRIISAADSAQTSVRLLNDNPILNQQNGSVRPEDIQKILDRKDRMDRFIQLIALLDRSKMALPLSTVHWVLAVNRQIKLGEKISINNQSIFKHLVMADKLGIPTGVYNFAHLLKRRICDWLLIERK